MGSSFNPQILVDKLAKLNSSQASIETLSHWCIFHMHKAKQVVETWDRQFHCSPREQRLAFLYLANDILQNSRRKGSEFVGEFWKVLPDALRDVIGNGDESGRNAVLRLISIWEERKVFGSRGQILKEELVGRQSENNNRNARHMGLKLRQPFGNTVDKIVSGYQVIYGGPMDEDVILNKCRNSISCIEKVDKEISTDVNSGQLHGSALQEVQSQQAVLRNCIEQLTAVASSRASLISNLREALQEQELKLEQVHIQLKEAQSQSDHVGNICRQLLNSDNRQLVAEQSSKEPHPSVAPQSFTPAATEQSAPVMYSRQLSVADNSGHIEEDPRKSAAAAVAAKLTASSSSAQVLSYVLSSFASESLSSRASEGVIGYQSSDDFPSEKRLKLESDQPYIPSQNHQQAHVSPFSHYESHQHDVASTSQQLTTNEVPPPSSAPPPPVLLVPPYAVPQYMPTAGSINSVQYNYGMAQSQQPPLPGYPAMTGISPYNASSTNSYQNFQVSEGFYNQASSMSAAPISRQ